MTPQWNADRSSLAPEMPPALTQGEIDQRVFDLYDEYCHGRIDRREFLHRAGALTLGGVSARSRSNRGIVRPDRDHAGSSFDPHRRP